MRLKTSYAFQGSFILVLFATVSVCLFYFAPRGLDITDDGSYLASSRYPQDILAAVSSYHYFTGLLFQLVHYHAAILRRLCIFLIAASGAALGWRIGTVLKIFRKEENFWFMQAVCAAFTGLGALLYFTRGGLFTPSYNTLIAVAINCSGFLYIEYCRLNFQPASSARRKLVLLLLQGFLAGFCFLVKTPVGVLLLAFQLLALFLLDRRDRILMPVLALISGLLLNFFFYFLLIQDFQSWLSMYANGVRESSWNGHNPKELLFFYAHDIQFQIYFMLRQFFPAFFLFFIALWAERALVEEGIFFTKISNLFFFLALLLIFSGFIFYGYQMGGGNNIFGLFQVYLFWMVLCSGIVPFFMKDRRMAVILAGLGILPFIGTFGTSNPLSVNAMMNLAPWFGCYILVFLAPLSSGLIERWAGFILFIIAFFASFQIISAVLVLPYRLQTGILQQNVPVTLGDPPNTFLLNQDTARFFLKMKNTAASCGLRPGDDMMAFGDLPGVVYALGARPLGTDWWMSSSNTGLPPEGIKASNDYILSLVPAFKVHQAFILEKISPFTFIPDFKNKGMAFPQDYQVCGAVEWPLDETMVRLWKPKSRH